MKNACYVLILVLTLFVVQSCDERKEPIIDNDAPNKEQPSEDDKGNENLDGMVTLEGKIASNVVYDGFKVRSLFDESTIKNNAFEIRTFPNNKIQTFYLIDEKENVLMLSRVSNIEKGKEIRFDVESTALAFITFHPLFAHIDSLAYDTLKGCIEKNAFFPDFCNEISLLIKEKKKIYSEENFKLNEVFSNLLCEMFSLYSADSRVIINDRKYTPFQLNSRENRLDMQILGWSPNYYGTAINAKKDTTRLVVKSHDDYGVLDIIIPNRFDRYGDIERYYFQEDGECNFSFSCRTEQNTIDNLVKLVNYFLDILGVGLDSKFAYDLAVELGPKIFQTINDAGYRNVDLTLGIFPFFTGGGYGDIESLMEIVCLNSLDFIVDKLMESDQYQYKVLLPIKNFYKNI